MMRLVWSKSFGSLGTAMKTSNPKVDELMALVGHALTTWGQVELGHCMLFQIAASGTVDNSALGKAYWAVMSFEGRQKMVDAALQEAFSSKPEYLLIWNNLNNRLVQKNRSRNKIAHGSVVEFSKADGSTEIYFFKYFYSKLQDHIVDGKFRNGLTAVDLAAIVKSFCELSSELDDFRQKYFAEQILPRETTQPDGSMALPQFHRP